MVAGSMRDKEEEGEKEEEEEDIPGQAGDD